MGFKLRLNTRYLQITNAAGSVSPGWFNISIGRRYIMVYLSTGAYWVGSTMTPSAKLTLRFKNKTLYLNQSYRIVFNRQKDYDTVYNKCVYYGHMQDNDTVVFTERH